MPSTTLPKLTRLIFTRLLMLSNFNYNLIINFQLSFALFRRSEVDILGMDDFIKHFTLT